MDKQALPDGKKFFETLFKDKKVTKWIVIIGIAGMVLILLSTVFGSKAGAKEQKIPENAISAEVYTGKLEEKIAGLAGGIDGVGKVKVMITLENGVEYVYAKSNKSTTDKTQDYDSGSPKKSVDKDSDEQNVILIDGQDGKQALVVTTLEPTVKGVVVVCEGGSDVSVVQSLTDAITTALHISSMRVSVVKSAP